MNTVEPRCQSLYPCQFPIIDSGFCVFHLPTGKEKTADHQEGQYAQLFRERFLDLLKQIENDASLSKYNFLEFQFPLIPLNYFSNRTFSKPVNFDQAVFWSNVDFRGATFEKAAIFNNAKFRGMATFADVTFEAEAHFLETKFKRETSFAGATFENKRPIFTDATFGGPTSFCYAVFNRGAKFQKVTFTEAVNFSWATFDDDTIFEGDTTKEGFCKESKFCGLRFRKDANVFLDHVNLTHASFADTNLESIKFRSVKWYKLETWPRRKTALWDEFRPDVSERTYSQVAENYAQLVKNYENKRNYEAAEEFHIGEMEIRRKAVVAEARRHRWKKYFSRLNSYEAYRFLSNYGTSYWQGLFVLLGLALLCSWVFLFAGLQASDGSSFIEYDPFRPASSTAAAVQWVRDYFRAIVFTLSVLTLQRQKAYEPSGTLSQLLVAIASLLLAGQAGLVLLAIRRRFRR